MKEKLKKIVSLAVIAMLMLTLAGCAGQPSEDVTPPSENQADNAVVDSDNSSPADSLPDEVILTVNPLDQSAVAPLGESYAEYGTCHNIYYVTEGESGKTMKIGDRYAVSISACEGLDGQFVFAVPSDKEMLTVDFTANQIYRVSLEDMSAEPILPQTEYGFTIEEYEAITGKWDTIFWFEMPVANKSCSHFAYWSNKFAADGSPAYEGGIWVYDLQTGEQTRIASPNGEDILVNPVEWIDDTHVLFEAGDTYYSYDIATETASEIVTTPGETYAIVRDNVLVCKGEKELTVINAKTGRKYIIQTDNPGNIGRVFVWEDIAAFDNNSNKNIYIVDMAKGTASLLDSPFGDLKPSIKGWTPDGKLVLEAYNIETVSAEGFYTVDVG